MTNHRELDNAARAGSGLSRRSLLGGAVLIPSLLLALAACGDDTKVQDAPTTTAAPTTTPATTGTPDTTATPDSTATPDTAVGADAIAHATGADDVVVRLGYVGGFVPAGYAFVNLPTVLISGDGHVYSAGATTMEFPGKLLPAIDVRTITEEGIQNVLRAAQEAGLLAAAPDYEDPTNIADAADTQLILNAAGGSFTHQAYALGLGTSTETGTRKVLGDFAAALSDIESLAGAENLGEPAPIDPTSYRIQARPLTAEDLAGYTEEPKPTEVPWPAATGVRLADAAECAEIEATTAGDVFADATQLTFFTEDGTTYQVSVAPVLPGDSC